MAAEFGAMMRRVVAVLLAAGGVSAAGCADAITPSNRPIVTVAGLISNGMSQPVPNADVNVRAYQPGQCGTGTVLQGRDVKSNNNGIYRAELISGITSLTACVRVSVGATTRDTTVTNAPQFSTVQVNVVVP